MNPIASTRHTLIVLAILTVVTTASYMANVRAHPVVPPSSRLPLYASVLIGELALLRYVRIGTHDVTLPDLAGAHGLSAAGIARDIVIAAALWWGARILLRAVQGALGQVTDHTSGLLPRTLPEKGLWILLSITAGVVEELVYRGYLQRQFAAWTGSIVVGVLLQAIAFGLSHGYQGWKSMVVISVYGVLFGIVAVWRRSLVPGMLAHAWTDIFSGLTG
jgi:membrane protease YdiL (CAAX protease family)